MKLRKLTLNLGPLMQAGQLSFLQGASRRSGCRSRRPRRKTEGIREKAKVVEAHDAGENRLCVAKQLFATLKGGREQAEVSESDDSVLVVIGIADISATVTVAVVPTGVFVDQAVVAGVINPVTINIIGPGDRDKRTLERGRGGNVLTIAVQNAIGRAIGIWLDLEHASGGTLNVERDRSELDVRACRQANAGVGEGRCGGVEVLNPRSGFECRPELKRQAASRQAREYGRCERRHRCAEIDADAGA
jgi:hypothetical protein